MRENNIGKMKSLLVAILMIASVMFIFVAVERVEAGWQVRVPGAFTIQNLTWGQDVTGQHTIQWTSANYADIYNVSIVPYDKGNAISGWWGTNGAGGRTLGETNSSSWAWNTTKWADGYYLVNVTAHFVNTSGARAGDINTNTTESTNGPFLVCVRNTLRGTPGVTQFQGGNYAIANALEHDVLVTEPSALYYGAEDVDIEVDNADLSGNWSDTYFLYKPDYNGSAISTGDYNLSWTQTAYGPVGTVPGVYTFADVDLDRAGIWIIDTNHDGNSNADFSNITNYNATVPAWFWVNTSSSGNGGGGFNLSIGDDTTFVYNNTNAAMTFAVKDSGAAIAGTYVVGDIRCEDNGSSIRGSNKYLTDGYQTELDEFKWFKNNSYDDPGNTEDGRYGFWSVGNYSAWAYEDIDWWTAGGLNKNGHLRYLENSYDVATDGWAHYNETYGSNRWGNGSASWIIGATLYNYTFCGQWDPPERNGSKQIITVTTGELKTTVTNSTQYFDFDGVIELTVTEYDTSRLEYSEVNPNLQCWIFNQADVNVSQYFYVYKSDKRESIDWDVAGVGKGCIDMANVSNGTIRINHSTWGVDSRGNYASIIAETFGTNGTWDIQLFYDVDSDRRNAGVGCRQWTEEWNKTTTFVLSSPASRLIFKIIDDDGEITGGTNTDGVIRSVPTTTTQPSVYLNFSVQNNNHRYLGSFNEARDKQNITISGDALWLEDGALTLDNFPSGMVSYSGGTWSVKITPIMAELGGLITLAIDWGSFGTITQNFKIGYDTNQNLINGTIVEISPTEFQYGTPVDLTVTVKSPYAGTPALAGATVSLYWLKSDGTIGDKINETGIPDVAGGNTFTFQMNLTQQDYWQLNTSNGWTYIKAPRNITAYATVTNVGSGWARSEMAGISDLKVTVEPNEIMAGKGLQNNDITITVTTIDSSGNYTGRPRAGSSQYLEVRIYNSTGGDVTEYVGNLLSGSATYLDYKPTNYNFSGKYFREPGVYTIHARNRTHKSWGEYNATFTVVPVNVECNLEEFIFGVDRNISAIFTATYKGETINNSVLADYLHIDNTSKQNSGLSTQYNSTWTNSSFSWGHTGAGTDQNSGNSSTTVSRSSGGLIDGVVTINEITADELDEKLNNKALSQPSERTITFDYKPGASGSVYANCTGTLKVKIPDVAASPASIPYNKAAELTLTVTGRGAGLDNVRVNITVPGMTAFSGAQTNTEGIVIFAFTPPATGDIIILIENRTSTLRVPVTAWKLYIEADSVVDEGASFIVTIKNGTSAGNAVADVTVTIRGIGTETTNTNGEATFTAPSVTSDRDYTISATLEGHAEDTETVTVINVPILTIVYPDEVEGCSTFEVIIADDAGNSIIGATITASDGEAYTSGVNGIAKIAALDKKGTMTLTASKTGFADSTTVTITVTACPGIPGFELLSLIAALGVAFILFRRRRR